MTQIIKVHRIGESGMEVGKVELDEARLMLKAGWVIADAKTQKVIWEIAPDVDEITIIGLLGGG